MTRLPMIVPALLLLASTACLPDRGDVAPASADGEDTPGNDGEPGGEDPGGEDPDGEDPGGEDPSPTDPPPVVRLLDLGAACVASVECASGQCALPCQGYGACAPAACATDADCAVPGSDAAHCCLGGTCAAVPGGVCGDRSGEQSASCATGGLTDCADGLACLNACTSLAVCAAECDDDEACGALGEGLRCYRTPGDGMRCVPDPDANGACKTNADCEDGTVCTPALSYDGTKAVTRCRPEIGRRILGTRCSEDQDCQAGYCIDRICTAVCETDADCACPEGSRRCRRDQTCLDTWFILGEGRRSAVPLCYPRDRCESASGCEDEACRAWPERKGWTTICEDPEPDQDPAGVRCTEDDQCDSMVCHDHRCRDVCGDDAHCGEEEVCDAVPRDGTPDPEATLGLCM